MHGKTNHLLEKKIPKLTLAQTHLVKNNLFCCFGVTPQGLPHVLHSWQAWGNHTWCPELNPGRQCEKKYPTCSIITMDPRIDILTL